jgi:hypothetical protein
MHTVPIELILIFLLGAMRTQAVVGAHSSDSSTEDVALNAIAVSMEASELPCHHERRQLPAERPMWPSDDPSG